MSKDKEKTLSFGMCVDEVINQIVYSRDSPKRKLEYFLKKGNNNDNKLLSDTIDSRYMSSVSYFTHEIRVAFGPDYTFKYRFLLNVTGFMFDMYDFNTNRFFLTDTLELEEIFNNTRDSDSTLKDSYLKDFAYVDTDLLIEARNAINYLINQRYDNRLSNLKWIDVKNNSNGQNI